MTARALLSLELLKRLEWRAGRNGTYYCPDCGGDQPAHINDCELAAAIREAPYTALKLDEANTQAAGIGRKAERAAIVRWLELRPNCDPEATAIYLGEHLKEAGAQVEDDEP